MIMETVQNQVDNGDKFEEKLTSQRYQKSSSQGCSELDL